MEPGRSHPATDGCPAADAEGFEQYSLQVKFQEAFEFSPEAQVITDCSGIILEANHTASALLRCHKEFLIGKPLALFSVPGFRSRFYECLWRLAQGLPADSFESSLARRGEGQRDVHITARTGDGQSESGRPLHWLIRDVTDWKRSEAARVELQRRLTTAQEDERWRLSRDLHDTVGQTLTAILLEVQAVRETMPLPPAALTRLKHVQQLADEMGRQLHDLTVRLRPTSLDDLGLASAVRQLAADWSARTGVAADFQPSSLGTERFSPEVETTLYRVVQEALTNVAKHARAGRVGVLVARRDGHAVAVVEDDGCGFDTASQPLTAGERLGLVGMRERVALAGGTLEIESRPGEGTTVFARIPLRDDERMRVPGPNIATK